MSRRLKTIAAEINGAGLGLRAEIDQGYCNTDRKPRGVRWRIPGKGRYGNRIRVFTAGGEEVLNHNSAETYLNNSVVERWWAEVRGKGMYWNGMRWVKVISLLIFLSACDRVNPNCTFDCHTDSPEIQPEKVCWQSEVVDTDGRPWTEVCCLYLNATEEPECFLASTTTGRSRQLADDLLTSALGLLT